ncbi:MAG: RluA family pseudouridine synthase [Ignavibacteria bacterium]|nr:RluA family pseudouridine synthase [Ignavibacteria bacterium]
MSSIEKNNYPEYIERTFTFKVPAGQKPERLDCYLKRSIENASRTKVQKAIDENRVQINGRQVKPSTKIQPNDLIVCQILKPPPLELIPEEIPLDILFEDEFLLVLNKAAGMVSHPGYGNRYGTLVNALLYHFGVREAVALEFDEEEDEEDESNIFLKDEIRPGIVHRLDKETSGLLVVAKNSEIHSALAEQFYNRTVERYYKALVWGNFKEDKGTITGDIGRSPNNRKTFAVLRKGGKAAITDYKVLKRYDFINLVRLKLHTGRTHQIRVHLSSINHPVFGDSFYGGDKIAYSGNVPKKRRIAEQCLSIAKRQMLHAAVLGFVHPKTKEKMHFECGAPEDFSKIIEILEDSIL